MQSSQIHSEMPQEATITMPEVMHLESEQDYGEGWGILYGEGNYLTVREPSRDLEEDFFFVTIRDETIHPDEWDIVYLTRLIENAKDKTRAELAIQILRTIYAMKELGIPTESISRVLKETSGAEQKKEAAARIADYKRRHPDEA